jgi:YHS domain-containing protein
MNASNESTLNRAAVLEDAGTPFTLVTVVRAESPTSAKPGAKIIVGEPPAATCCGDGAASEPDTETSALDPISGMSVLEAGAEYTFEFEGATYYSCCAARRHAFAKAPETNRARGAGA